MTALAYAPEPFGWPRCLSADGCQGVRVNPYQGCWAHLDPEDCDRALSHLEPGGRIDARGTHLTAELLTKILAALRRDSGPPELGDARFDRAHFAGDARFDGAHFAGNASFVKAHFAGNASFGAPFREARFNGDGAQFAGDARFDGAHFAGNASFVKAQFAGNASFVKAHFAGNASFGTPFREARFNGNARFDRARFSHDASFRKAQFSGDARFMGTQFDGDARLEEACLKAERVLGPVLVEDRLALDETTVAQHLVVEAFARRFTCIGTKFDQGATIRLRWADVVLDSCMFGQPTTVSFAQLPFRGRGGGFTPEGGLQAILFAKNEKAFQREKQCATPERCATPRLLSIRGVDVSNLTLVEFDLRHCLFQGAHKRSELQIVGARPFADSPDDRVQLFGRIPLWRRWTPRQVLAEEHWYRSCSGQGEWDRLSDSSHWYDSCNGPKDGWNPPERGCLRRLANATGQEIDLLTPDRLASVYRALRKAQEDNKNEPGAADFYYGEMEMRRLCARPPRVEWFVLNLYWLISGYSLRGLRTVLALLMLLAVATVLIAAVGFPDHKQQTSLNATIVGTPPRQSVQVEPQPAATVTNEESFGARLRTAAVATLEGTAFRSSEQQLTYPGRVIQDLVRIVGPILLVLALLAVRNRVKR